MYCIEAYREQEGYSNCTHHDEFLKLITEDGSNAAGLPKKWVNNILMYLECTIYIVIKIVIR